MTEKQGFFDTSCTTKNSGETTNFDKLSLYLAIFQEELANFDYCTLLCLNFFPFFAFKNLLNKAKTISSHCCILNGRAALPPSQKKSTLEVVVRAHLASLPCSTTPEMKYSKSSLCTNSEQPCTVTANKEQHPLSSPLPQPTVINKLNRLNTCREKQTSSSERSAFTKHLGYCKEHKILLAFHICTTPPEEQQCTHKYKS